MKTTAYLGTLVLLILALASPGLAQTQADADAAYRAIYDIGANPKDPKYDAKKAAQLSEEYLAKFKEGGPGAGYRDAVFQVMFNAHVATKNLPKLIEIAERLGELHPSADPKLKAQVYSTAMAAANESKNTAKVIEFGEKTVQLDANNISALYMLVMAIPATLPQDAAAKDAALGKALDYATKLKGVAKPQGVDEAQWNVVRQAALSTAGFVHLTRSQYTEAATEYEEVVKLNPKNQDGWFRLGSAYQGLTVAAQKEVLGAYTAENDAKTAKAEQARIDELVANRTKLETDYQEKRDKAIDGLAKAVAVGGPLSSVARDALERLYKNKNNDSLEGLDALIAQKKAELGTE